jgi:hypothetical protein
MKDKLIRIQNELKAPKGNRNDFGKFNYRSVEDILQAVKPLLEREGLLMVITDEIVNIGDRNYIKAIVRIDDGDRGLEVSALAREALTKKGMDDAQLTGSCSSYARKYALGGMFLIDNNQDIDSMDNSMDTSTLIALAKSKGVTGEIMNKLKSQIPSMDREGFEKWVAYLGTYQGAK